MEGFFPGASRRSFLSSVFIAVTCKPVSPILLLIITHCFGLRYMAQIYGSMLLALLPGGIAGPIFAAAIHDQHGSYSIAFQAFAALNILAVVALFRVRNERPAR